MNSIWYIITPVDLACWALVLAGASWAIRKWRRSSKFEPPRWRSALAYAALGLAGAWAILGPALMLWATPIRDKPLNPIWYVLMNPAPDIAALLFTVGPPAILVWVVRRWWRSSPRICAPAWRSYCAIGAIALVGLSLLLRFVTGIWVDINGELVFDNPAFRWLFGAGFLATPIALLVSFLGKGNLRWPALGLSALMTYVWIFFTAWDM